MIYLKNASKYYRKKDGNKHYLFKNIDLEFPEKKNIAIMGRNGAGKSSLLRIIGGIDSLSEGTFVNNYKTSWVLALSGGFQGSLNGLDNTQFIARIYGAKEEEIQDIIQKVKDFSELGDFFYEPVKKYSTGMKARLGFAISILFDFEYYLIDETLSVGDLKFREKSLEKIKEIHKENNIIIVSHDFNIIKQFCDCAIILDDGKFSFFDDIEKAIIEYTNKIKSI